MELGLQMLHEIRSSDTQNFLETLCVYRKEVAFHCILRNLGEHKM